MNEKVCKYYFTENVQGIIHVFCKNELMLKTNSINDDKMICSDFICKNCIYFDPVISENKK